MKAEEIHIALKNNQQVFKLAIADELKTNAAKAKAILNKEAEDVKIMYKDYDVIKAAEAEVKKAQQLQESHRKDSAAHKKIARSLKDDLMKLMEKADFLAKELGVNPETISGYKQARTAWSDLADAISRNPN